MNIPFFFRMLCVFVGVSLVFSLPFIWFLYRIWAFFLFLSLAFNRSNFSNLWIHIFIFIYSYLFVYFKIHTILFIFTYVIHNFIIIFISIYFFFCKCAMMFIIFFSFHIENAPPRAFYWPLHFLYHFSP